MSQRGINLTEEQAMFMAEKARIDADIKQTASFYRKYRSKPLLVLKVLDISYDGGSLEAVYAYGISFQTSKSDRAVEYVYPRKALTSNYE